MIDLHSHSNYSDGLLNPTELLNKALAANIQVLALTDHDTTAGLADLKKAAKDKPIRIINGIELSAVWKKYDIHILGLNINPLNEVLQELIERQNQNRVARALKIGEKLRLCGIEDAYSKACEVAGHERVGRPHFAKVLMNEGRVKSGQEAFKRFLAKGRSSYVESSWLSINEVIAAILSAQGEAVLAHPLKYLLTRTRLRELISDFKETGGVGLEVVSGGMELPRIQEMAGLCLEFNLYSSTGSDYHGDNLSYIPLGKQQPLPVNCMPIWHLWNI